MTNRETASCANCGGAIATDEGYCKGCGCTRKPPVARTPQIDVPCMRVQICDHALHGCGRIIENAYSAAQICDYRRHPDWTPPAGRPWENAPYMRCAVVAEVVGFPMNPLTNDAEQRLITGAMSRG